MILHEGRELREGESPPERRDPIGIKPNIRAVKEIARIEDVTPDYGEFRLQGPGRLLGRCISSEHEDRTPSMTIFTDEQRFKCFGIGCGAHGDVLDLVMLAEGCELHEATMILSQRYGIELPGRPDSWRRKQERQKPIREAIDRARFEHLRRRLFRRFFAEPLSKIEDPAERKEETHVLWREADNLARLLVVRIAAEKGSS